MKSVMVETYEQNI